MGAGMPCVRFVDEQQTNPAMALEPAGVHTVKSLVEVQGQVADGRRRVGLSNGRENPNWRARLEAAHQKENCREKDTKGSMANT
jgi:hypothetical protein